MYLIMVTETMVTETIHTLSTANSIYKYTGNTQTVLLQMPPAAQPLCLLQLLQVVVFLLQLLQMVVQVYNFIIHMTYITIEQL